MIYIRKFAQSLQHGRGMWLAGRRQAVTRRTKRRTRHVQLKIQTFNIILAEIIFFSSNTIIEVNFHLIRSILY